MREPEWYARLPRWARKVVDQLAHAAIGAAIAGLVGGLSRLRLSWRWSALAGGCASALGAIVYELAQNLGDAENNVADAVLDAAVWSLAGAAVAVSIWGVGHVRRKR